MMAEKMKTTSWGKDSSECLTRLEAGSGNAKDHRAARVFLSLGPAYGKEDVNQGWVRLKADSPADRPRLQMEDRRHVDQTIREELPEASGTARGAKPGQPEKARLVAHEGRMALPA